MAKTKIILAATDGNNSLDPALLRSLVDDLIKLDKEQTELRMRSLATYNRAEDCGIDRKALKLIVKITKNELDPDFKEKVNQYFRALGDTPLFATLYAA